MDRISLIGIIGFVTVFISFLLGLFLLTVKTKHKLSNVLFAFFIILAGIDISGFFIYKFNTGYPVLEMIRRQCSLLGMPLFYLYVLSVCYSDFKLKPKHLLHLLPFIISNLLITPGFYLADDLARNIFMENISKMPPMQFKRVLSEVQVAFYMVAIFLTLKKSRRIFLENYTGPSLISYKWLFQLAVISAVVHVTVFFRVLFQWYSDNANAIVWSHLAGALISLSILCWFVLKALYQPELFRGVDSKLSLVKDILPAPEADTGPEPAAVINDRIAALKAYMTREAPYLEPALTIQELASRMQMPARELSVLINHHLNQHFFDFVNGYRIEKAKELLKNSTKQDLNIQEVLYEVGFNSKSSFNTAFKKHTNLTPTQYRNSSLSGN